MKAHADERPAFFDLSDHFSRSDSIEDALRDAFEAARAGYVDPREPLDVLREIGARQGTYVTMLAVKGFTDEEIARVIGWTAKRVAAIRARYVDEARVVVSMVDRMSA